MCKMYGFMLVKLYCLLFILLIGGGGAYLSGDQQQNVRKMKCCVRRNSNWILGKGSSLRKWSVTGTGYLGKWSWH